MYTAAGSRQSQRTIARLWDITIEAIQALNPAAIKLLHILACYAPDGRRAAVHRRLVRPRPR